MFPLEPSSYPESQTPNRFCLPIVIGMKISLRCANRECPIKAWTVLRSFPLSRGVQTTSFSSGLASIGEPVDFVVAKWFSFVLVLISMPAMRYFYLICAGKRGGGMIVKSLNAFSIFPMAAFCISLSGALK